MAEGTSSGREVTKLCDLNWTDALKIRWLGPAEKDGTINLLKNVYYSFCSEVAIHPIQSVTISLARLAQLLAVLVARFASHKAATIEHGCVLQR